MSNESKHTRLFSEFPPVSREAWEDIIKSDLKGADYDKKLVWKTHEGINVKPYYRAEDLSQIKWIDALPGKFPFHRGNKINHNQWYIRQDIEVDDFIKANNKAIEIVSKGATSLGFIINGDKELTFNNVETLLSGIDLENIEINAQCGAQSRNFVLHFKKYIEIHKINIEKVRGSLAFDPFGYLTLHGNFCKSLEYSMDYCAELIRMTEQLHDFRVIAVKGLIFHNSGSTLVEELAFSLSEAVEYIQQLVARGISVTQTASKLKFQFAVGSNYFMEIAKIRAARGLWAVLLRSYGVERDEDLVMRIHSVASDWNKTVYDSYANLLRTTTEAMAAVLGGADSLTVKPFDFITASENPFSERIARNQQLILKHEAHFNEIADPAAGSYYIENLTQSIAEAAWSLFLEVDQKGGFFEAMKQGVIQDRIAESAARRDADIASRRETILGTNQYPDFAESIDHLIDEKVFHPQDDRSENAMFKNLKPYRGAMAFEALRYKTDLAAINKKRPVVFMFTYGNLAMRRARSQFSSNFFACAGFKTIDTNGFPDIDSGVKAAKDAGADIVVICSSDEEYALIAPEIYTKLKDFAIVVVAGYPKDILEQLQAAGIKNFIHVRSNVLETLKQYQQMLGL